MTAEKVTSNPAIHRNRTVSIGALIMLEMRTASHRFLFANLVKMLKSISSLAANAIADAVAMKGSASRYERTTPTAIAIRTAIRPAVCCTASRRTRAAPAANVPAVTRSPNPIGTSPSVVVIQLAAMMLEMYRVMAMIARLFFMGISNL